MIDNSIADVNDHGQIDRLVIAVDSEDMTYDEKYSEIEALIKGKYCNAEIYIIIQHFCIETWALGNQILIKRNPENKLLCEYLQFFNVIDNDPELLPGFKKYTRSQFAYKYLRQAVNERYRNLSYTKDNPKVLLNRKYFERVKNRYTERDHIRSFFNFLKAFCYVEKKVR